MTAAVNGICIASNRCGCRIVGTGSLSDPLRIYWCEHHSVINDVRDTAPLARDARAMLDSAKARDAMTSAKLLDALISEIADTLQSIVGPEGSSRQDWTVLIPPRRTPDPDGVLGLAIDVTGTLHTARGDGFDGARELVHLEVVSRADAVAIFGLHQILDALADALDGALGQKKAAERIEKRNAVMRAVITLLRKGDAK